MSLVGKLATLIICEECDSDLGFEPSFLEEDNSFCLTIQPCSVCIDLAKDEATKEKDKIIKEILKIKG